MTRKQGISAALCCAMLLGCLTGCGRTQAAEDHPVSALAASAATQETYDQVYAFTSADGQMYDILGPQTQLPVNLDITYLLDDSAILPEALAGASGHLEMTYHFSTKDTFSAKVNGKTEELPVPYVMLTGLVLDNAHFQNVTVSSGKVLDDGNRTAVAAFALPALANALELDDQYLPSTFTLSADVQDFSLMNAYIYGTSELFSQVDLTKLDDLEELNQAADQVRDAMQQLTDGTDQLYEGLCTLLLKSQELQTGVNQLATGASTLSDGANQLNDGLNTLSAGADQLQSGLQTLSGNSAALNNGAAQIFNSLLNTAAAQIRDKGLEVPNLTISNYAQVLNDLVASLDESKIAAQAQAAARAQVTAAVNAKTDEIQAGVIAAVQENVRLKVNDAVYASVSDTVRSKTDEIRVGVTTAVQAEVAAKVKEATRQEVTTAVLSANGLTNETYKVGIASGAVTASQQAAIESTIETKLASAEVQQKIQDTIAQQMQSSDVLALIDTKIEDTIRGQIAGAFAANAVQTQINATVVEQMKTPEVQAAIAENTKKQIADLIEANLASPEVQQQITAALEAAASGAANISAVKTQLDAFASFYYGLETYTSGVDTAAAASGQLATGSHDLASGSKVLAAGAGTLKNGVLTLQNNIPALLDGITQLRDGSKALDDGLRQFDRDAVSKALSTLDDAQLDTLIPRLKALQDGAEACACPQFLIRVDEIGA